MLFNKKHKPLKIIFTNAKDYPTFSAPQPAKFKIPDWYKSMDNKYPQNAKLPEALFTIKNCMPVFDALTAGYILTTPTDIFVDEIDKEIIYKTPLPKIIEHHPNSQSHTHPKSMHERTPKILNGFTIQTPKGYSCLFISPMHNSNPWFEILPGIVDTDTYLSFVNFPFILKDKNFRGLIPANTPMVQVIPFKREQWESANGGEKETKEAFLQNTTLNAMWRNRYRTLYHSKKSWH